MVSEHWRVNFTQQKTKGVEYTPISDQAYELCGERLDDNRLVFEGLPAPSWISKPLARWIKAAGITKHITWHLARHIESSLLLKYRRLQNIFSLIGNDLETSEILYFTSFCSNSKERFS